MAADNDLIVAVERMKKGEEEGFNLAYQKTYNYVYFRARQIMKDDEDALDLVQIVYIEAYKSIDTLDKPENIFAWLGAITYRQGMKIFRKKNEILLDDELKDEVFGNIVSDDRSLQPELSAEQKEQQKMIGELIDKLPETQRTTLVAFYYDGLSVEEIADTMECSTGTVKSRLNYARNFLRKQLEGNKDISRSKVGAMALSGVVIYGAIQAMSEQTVMAAPVAQSMYNSICQGVGIAAGTLAVAGTVASAGASAAGSAAATVSAGNAAAAGTTAAATAGSGAAAAGTATATAATAASAATAKSVAVAVAVAVAGAGAGTAVVTNNSNTTDVVVSADHIVELDNYPTGEEELTVVPVSVNEILSDNTVSSNGGDKTSQSGNNNKDEKPKETKKDKSSEKSSHSKNASSEKKKAKKEKAPEEPKKVFTVSDNAREKIAGSVASVLFYTGKKKYDGGIDNQTLNAAYQFGQAITADSANYSSISNNEAYIDMSRIELFEHEGKKVKMKGSFIYARRTDDGSWDANKYKFTLNGKVDENDSSLFGIIAKKLVIKLEDSAEAIDMDSDLADNTVEEQQPDDVSDITDGIDNGEDTVSGDNAPDGGNEQSDEKTSVSDNLTGDEPARTISEDDVPKEAAKEETAPSEVAEAASEEPVEQ